MSGGIVGVGIDVVDIGRFEESITRTPRLIDKLFTAAEAELPLSSLAARFAAKEAIAKALGAPGDLEWHDAEVVRDDSGQPRFVVRGTVAARLAALGGGDISLSLSHDAGIAAAIVVIT
ncbi:MAG TPA: holo-ACP synthase [Marmoricola sp.]